MKQISIQTKSIGLCRLISWSTFLFIRKSLNVIHSACFSDYLERGFNLLRGDLKDKRRSRHDFMLPKGNVHLFICKCINEDAWDSYPVYKMAFYFQRHYTLTIKTCRDISSVTHADGQRCTHSANSYLNTFNNGKPIFSVD